MNAPTNTAHAQRNAQLLDECRERLSYDPETGVFIWLVRVNSKVPAGSVAGTVGRLGYRHIRIFNKAIGAHRLAWAFVHGHFPTREIDHINGVRADNRICNLRDVSRQVNAQNERVARKHNQSGVIGVRRIGNSFVARIWTGSKEKHLGCFKDADSASEAYRQAKRQLHAGCTI